MDTLGRSRTRAGTVTVNGNGSSWTVNQSLVVGYGDGTLMVENGGDISNDQGWIGYRDDCIRRRNRHRPRLNVDQQRRARRGTRRYGIVTVSAGARLTNTIGSIASRAGSRGTATITGSGSIGPIAARSSSGNPETWQR